MTFVPLQVYKTIYYTLYIPIFILKCILSGVYYLVLFDYGLIITFVLILGKSEKKEILTAVMLR
jgi:hypothetical protein